MDIKKISRISMLLALSVVLGIIESSIPITFSVPGVKLGLANIIILSVIYVYGIKDGLYVSISRVLIVSLLTGSFLNITFYFSLGGAILSVAAMYIAIKARLSIITVSIIGAIFHSLGQIIAGSIILDTSLIYYLPMLGIISVITGTLVGYASKEIVKYLQKQL